jgi:hydrogenase nickel incorporation protein HypA/HybF
MYELSIAMGIVDAALEEAQKRSVQVSGVHLRLGALSGVVKDALLFSYEVACQDTPLQGSRLIVEDVPGCVLSAMQRAAEVSFRAVVRLS